MRYQKRYKNAESVQETLNPTPYANTTPRSPMAVSRIRSRCPERQYIHPSCGLLLPISSYPTKPATTESVIQTPTAILILLPWNFLDICRAPAGALQISLPIMVLNTAHRNLQHLHGFTYIISSPYYPQSNDLNHSPERTVQSVKGLLKDSNDPHIALLCYWATPLAWCNLRTCCWAAHWTETQYRCLYSIIVSQLIRGLPHTVQGKR